MSLKVPNCSICKHLCDDVDDRMCCDAFPNGIPDEKITWGGEDIECAHGIKFESIYGVKTEFVPAPDSVLAKMLRI